MDDFDSNEPNPSIQRRLRARGLVEDSQSNDRARSEMRPDPVLAGVPSVPDPVVRTSTDYALVEAALSSAPELRTKRSLRVRRNCLDWMPSPLSQYLFGLEGS